jgi:hypothetical protein
MAGVLLAMVLAGCGGSSNSPPSVSGATPATRSYGAPPKVSARVTAQMPPAPSTERQAPAAGAGTSGIPQNNGGDQDADNNGGPSDGDGNV